MPQDGFEVERDFHRMVQGVRAAETSQHAMPSELTSKDVYRDSDCHFRVTGPRVKAGDPEGIPGMFPAVIVHRNLDEDSVNKWIDAEKVMAFDALEYHLDRDFIYPGHVQGKRESGGTKYVCVMVAGDGWLARPIRVIARRTVSSGDYKYRYTVIDLHFTPGYSTDEPILVDDWERTWDSVIELNDNFVPVGRRPRYTLFRSPQGVYYFHSTSAVGDESSSSSSSSSSQSRSASSASSSSSESQSQSQSDQGGVCVEVVTEVECLGGGIVVTHKTLCGTVRIGGVDYPIKLTLQ